MVGFSFGFSFLGMFSNLKKKKKSKNPSSERPNF